MAGCHDRLINVPINKEDIDKTLKKLPHTPTEAGITTVSLKRKLGMKNNHVEQVIDSRTKFEWLEYLRLAGHPSYKEFESPQDYKKRC